MTAKVAPSEAAEVPHHLFGVVGLCEQRFTVREYLLEFAETLRGIQSRGRTPVVVGGTNYYIEATLRHFIPQQDSLQLQPLEPGLRARIADSLERADFDEMIGLLREVDPEAAKLTIKNDSRRLANALQRLLNHQTVVDSDMCMDEGEHPVDSEVVDTSHLISEFLLINLDCEDMQFLEARLHKRILSMFDREGGAAEILRVCRDVILHKQQFDESKPPLLNAMETLHSNTSVGVLQSIGYKEFFDFVFEMLRFVGKQIQDSLANKPIKEQIASLFDAALSLVGQILEERLNGASEKSVDHQEIHVSIDKCIQKLTASTLLLTKKQRRYLKNRLLPRIAHCEVSTYMINSVEDFFAQLPIIKERMQQFLQDDRPAHMKSAEQMACVPIPPKTHHRCEICNVDLVGVSMWRQHLQSKTHRYKYGKSKKLALDGNPMPPSIKTNKKQKNAPVASIFDDEDSEQMEEADNSPDTRTTADLPRDEHQ